MYAVEVNECNIGLAYRLRTLLAYRLRTQLAYRLCELVEFNKYI